MNIVTTFYPNYHKFNSIVAAFAAIEPDTIIWIPKHKPAFDMFDEIKPDVVFLRDTDFTPDLIAALKEYKPITIVFGMKVPEDIKVHLLCIDSCVSNKIVDRIQLPYIVIEPMANIVQVNNGIVADKYKSDILCASNILTQNDALYLVRLSGYDRYSIKICGNSPIPIPQYLGTCKAKTAANLIASTKIVLDFNNESLMDAAFNGIFCLSNVESNIYPSFSEFHDLINQLDHFLSDEKHRKYYIKKAKKHAIENTSLHTLQQMLNKLDITSHNNNITGLINQWVK